MAIGLGSVLGGIVGAGASIYNSIQSNRWNQTMLNAQRQENQLNRDFNANEAALQRQYGLDVMHEQQRYNSPQEFVKRLQAAGLNPALAYGQLGSDAATAPGGSAASYSGSITPTAYQGLDPLAASQAAKNFAEASNINQDTHNKELQGTILETESRFKEALISQQLEIGSLDIDLKGFDLHHLKPAEVSKAYAEAKNLDKSSKMMEQQTANLAKQWESLGSEAKIKQLEAAFLDATFDARIDKLANDLQISNMEVKTFMLHRFAEIGNLNAQSFANTRLAELYNEEKYKVHTENGLLLPLQAGLLRAEGARMSFTLSQDKKFDSAQRIIGMCGDVVDCVGNLAGIIATRGGSYSFHESRNTNVSNSTSHSYNRSYVTTERIY